MAGTAQLQDVLTEDRLIDALRGCRDVKELKALEQRLASTTDAPPLFT